jgi:hypothetical protein
MPNFKLVFKTVVPRKDGWGDGYGTNRVISADNIEVAKKIAEAMSGEEIYPLQYIGKVVSVYKTKLRPDLSSFSDEYTWNRVFNRLGLVMHDIDLLIFDFQTIPRWIREELDRKFGKPSRPTNSHCSYCEFSGGFIAGIELRSDQKQKVLATKVENFF